MKFTNAGTFIHIAVTIVMTSIQLGITGPFVLWVMRFWIRKHRSMCQMAVSLPIILTAELANEVLEPLYVVLSVSLRILSGGLHIALGSVDTIV